MPEALDPMKPMAEHHAPSLQPQERTVPRLAVVITCYNYETFVERAIRSVLNQGRDDCEVVVVDDGSTDESWAAISRTGVTAFRIANGGQQAACLFGFDQTRAPYVLFLDADDELSPGALDVIMPRLDAEVAKLQFPLTPINPRGEVLGAPRPVLKAFRHRQSLVREVLRTGVYTSPPTSGNVFRRDVCELLREADYDRAVDGVILFAAPFFGDVLSLSQPLGRYRLHDRNDSGVGRTPESAVFRRDIRRFLDRMDHLRRILARQGLDGRLVDPRTVFYFRETCFWLTVSSGEHPPPAALPGLLYALARQRGPARKKIGMAALFVAATFLPNRGARSLLDCRFLKGGILRRLLNDLLAPARWRKLAPRA